MRESLLYKRIKLNKRFHTKLKGEETENKKIGSEVGGYNNSEDNHASSNPVI